MTKKICLWLIFLVFVLCNSIFSNTVEEQIREDFAEYIMALENYDVAQYKNLISEQSLRSGEGNVKQYQMRNQKNKGDGSVFHLLGSGSRRFTTGVTILTYRRSQICIWKNKKI